VGWWGFHWLIPQRLLWLATCRENFVEGYLEWLTIELVLTSSFYSRCEVSIEREGEGYDARRNKRKIFGGVEFNVMGRFFPPSDVAPARFGKDACLRRAPVILHSKEQR